MKMAEPISTGAAGAAGGAAAWKAAGGAAGVAVFGAAAVAVVVMSMTLPKDKREWATALISTIMCSLSLGSYLSLHYLDLDQAIMQAIFSGDQVQTMMQFAVLGGTIFASGLPGWFLVRAAFRYMAKHENKDLLEIAQEVKNGAAIIG